MRPDKSTFSEKSSGGYKYHQHRTSPTGAVIHLPPINPYQTAMLGLKKAARHLTGILTDVDAVVLLAVSGLLARASLLGTLAPFHFAIAAAAAAMGCSLPLLTLQVLVITVVRAVTGTPLLALGEALALGTLVYYVSVWSNRRDGTTGDHTPAHAALMAAFTAAGGGLYSLLILGGGQFLLVNTAFQVGMAALMAVLFLYAFSALLRYRSVIRSINGDIEDSVDDLTGLWDELTGDGEGGVQTSNDVPSLTRDEWLSLAVLMTASSAGLHGLALGPVRLDLMLCVLLVIWAGRLGGAGAGAATGAGIAGMAVLNGMFDPVTIAVQAVAGLLAGLLAEYGAVGGAGGYIIGFLLFSAFYTTPDAVVASMWSVIPAAALVLLSQHWWWPSWVWRQQFTKSDAREDGAAKRNWSAVLQQLSRRRWWRRDGVLTRAAHPARRRMPPAPGSGMTPRRARYSVEQGLWVVTRYAELARQLAQTFEQLTPNEERFRQRTVSELINNIALQVCPSCVHHATCWDQEFLKTYQGLSRLLTHRETGTEIAPDDIPQHLRMRCPREERLVTAVNSAYELFELNYRWWQRVDATRRTVTNQLRAVGDVLERSLATAVEAAATGEEPRGAALTLPYRVGVARVPKEKKLVSGDSYLHRQIGEDRLVLVLSDGMGAGMRAAAESRNTVNLLEKLLELGFDETTAVRSVNQMLLLRPYDEVFTTLDLVLLCLRDGSTRFVKIGAAPTFIKRGENVTVIRAGTLPMGILSEPDIQITRRVLQRDDVVVMLTDGVLQAWDKISAAEDWIRGFLTNLDRTEPRHIAAELLREAMRRSARGVRDDMTVMVLKML